MAWGVLPVDVVRVVLSYVPQQPLVIWSMGDRCLRAFSAGEEGPQMVWEQRTKGTAILGVRLESMLCSA